MKTTKEILVAARALIAEKGWCTGVMARDANGHAVGEQDSNAACYCVLGALTAANGDEIPNSVYVAFAYANGAESIVDWNDVKGRTKEEVLEAFDKAIAAQP